MCLAILSFSLIHLNVIRTTEIIYIHFCERYTLCEMQTQDTSSAETKSMSEFALYFYCYISTSADLEVQLVQLNHYDRVPSN